MPTAQPSAALIEDLPEYSTLFSQCFSPDGAFLAVGGHRGWIVVHRVSALVGRGGTEPAVEPVHVSFAAANEGAPVLALATTKEELVVGSIGEISGWRWTDLQKKLVEKSWTIALPPLPGSGSENEVNWIEYDGSVGTAGRLIVGSGENSIKVFDLETRQKALELNGHENYIHGISHCPSTNLTASASEDGTVRLWDTRKSQPMTAVLKPSDKSNLCRPSIGKWIGAVNLSSEWLACGGGPRASLWHLRTLSPSEPLPPADDNGIHVIRITSDRILIGGAINKMLQTTLTGEILAEVPVSSSCLYSIEFQESPVNILSCVGSSSRIDICSPNFSYRDRTILFRPKTFSA